MMLNWILNARPTVFKWEWAGFIRTIFHHLFYVGEICNIPLFFPGSSRLTLNSKNQLTKLTYFNRSHTINILFVIFNFKINQPFINAKTSILFHFHIWITTLLDCLSKARSTNWEDTAVMMREAGGSNKRGSDEIF